MWDDTYQLSELLEQANTRLRQASGLADSAPFSERTFYYYVQQRLLARRAGRRGPGTRYPAGFVDRLIFIRRLQKDRGLTLAEIRLNLEQCGDEVIREVAAGSALPARSIPLNPHIYRHHIVGEEEDDVGPVRGGGRGDGGRQEHAPSRVAGGNMDARKCIQEREHAVGGEGLQDSRRAEHAGHQSRTDARSRSRQSRASGIDRARIE